MSHAITVQGNFGSAEHLKEELDSQGIKYFEKTSGSDQVLTFERRYNQYGNPMIINLTRPDKTTMDGDIAHVVRKWYKGAAARHTRYQLMMQGIDIVSDTVENGEIVLRVAVG